MGISDLLDVLHCCNVSKGDILYVPSDVTQILVKAKKIRN